MFKSIFGKLFNINNDKITKDLSSLIFELLNALRDDKITKEEKDSLRKKAYDLLLSYGLDEEK